MKKILIAVTNDLTYDRRMQRIAGSLVEGGYDVTMIGRQLNSSLSIEIQSFKQVRLKCKFNKGKLFYLEYNLRLFWYLLRQKANIVYAVDLDTIMACFIASVPKGWKRVYDAHEYFTEVPEVVNRPVTQFVWTIVAALFIPLAHLRYTVGQALAEVMGKRYQCTFHVIRNVPPKLETNIVPGQRGDYILYQGALNEGRGLEQLINAMTSIDVPLKIAGEGDLSQQLRVQVQRMGLQDRVEFLGFVKPADLPALTKGAIIGINILENKGQSYYYSLANKYFDYIQAGVPSLNMSFPEYVTLNREHEVAVLIDDLSPETLVKAVNGLIENKEKYNALQQHCIDASAEYNWEKEAEKLLNLYREF